MEPINIIITGFPNAGKSTITNSFTGTTYSKVNTQKITDFSMGTFDTYTSSENINQLIDERMPIKLPYPINCQLSHDWNYSMSDLVGASIDNNKKLKLGSKNIKYIKEHKNLTDIIIVVFDINKFDDDMENNLELLKIVSENVSNPHKLIVVLNKCDKVVVTEVNTTFSDKEDYDKFKRYEEFLKLNGYNEVFPLCAKNSSIISAGDNNALTEEYEKEHYINERLHSDSATLLTRSGFNNIVMSINDFLASNKDRLINKHVLLELFDPDEEHDLKSITSLLNRMQKTSTGEEQYVAYKLKEMILTHLIYMNDDHSENEFTPDLESAKKELSELSQKYSYIFNTCWMK